MSKIKMTHDKISVNSLTRQNVTKRKCHCDKMLHGQMSYDKMSHGHNVTEQTVAWTKYHRTICHNDKMIQKISQKKCATNLTEKIF